MLSRRSPSLVIAQILEICSDGAGKTKILYQANLSTIKGKYHLDNLVRKGYIETIPNGSRLIYKTTPKGCELQGRLNHYADTIDRLYSDV